MAAPEPPWPNNKNKNKMNKTNICQKKRQTQRSKDGVDQSHLLAGDQPKHHNIYVS